MKEVLLLLLFVMRFVAMGTAVFWTATGNIPAATFSLVWSVVFQINIQEATRDARH